MDVLLLGGALSLALSISPKILSLNNTQEADADGSKLSPLSFSLCCSLSLFALSVLEAAPSSWLVLLDNQVVNNHQGNDNSLNSIESTADDGTSGDEDAAANNYYFSVSNAYFAVLSILSAYILVVFPSILGVFLLERVLQRPSCNIFFCCSNTTMQMPWWMKLCTGIIGALYKFVIMILTLMIFMVQKICGKLPWGKKKLGGISRRDSNERSALPLTKDNIIIDSSTVSHSQGYRVGCLASKIHELFVLKGGTLCLGSLLGISGTYGVLRALSPFIIEPKSTGNTLALALSWVCAIGIVLSTLLNGFGSVSMPHSCLAGLFMQPIRPETVKKAAENLQKTQESLQTRKQQLKDVGLTPVSLSSGKATSASNSSSKSKSFWSSRRGVKKTFSGIGENVSERKRKLVEEINFLESLVEEMEEDIEDMKYTQKIEAASRTTMGRVHSSIGVLFSFILLMRLYSAFTAIHHQWNHDQSATEDFQPPRKRDSVTSLVLWLLGHHMVSEKDYAQASQFISLFLTALLSFSQVRAFLRTVSAIHRRLNHLFCASPTVSASCSNRQSPRSGNNNQSPTAVAGTNESRSVPVKTTGPFHMHALAALMGSYFMACLILAKMMVSIPQVFYVRLFPDKFVPFAKTSFPHTSSLGSLGIPSILFRGPRGFRCLCHPIGLDHCFVYLFSCREYHCVGPIVWYPKTKFPTTQRLLDR